MKRFRGHRYLSLSSLLVLVAVIAGCGFAMRRYSRPVRAVNASASLFARGFFPAALAHRAPDMDSNGGSVSPIGLTMMVRGYIAAAVGRSKEAESSGGIFAREVNAKNIYLPGVTVFLEDPQTARRSDEVRTDLSGRFTVRVPAEGRYRLCWRSKIYGDDCLGGFISAGREPLFLSTILIKVPPKRGFVASFGKVRFADDSATRTLEPLDDINSFAVVSLVDASKNVIAEVPVNNFGEYLLPYLPAKDPVQLIASIEQARSAQTIQPEAYRKFPRLVQYHLTIQNSPPRLDAIVPVSNATGKRMQVGSPGDTVVLRAVTRDRDGDPVNVRWSESAGGGTLSAKTGDEIKWTLPARPGLYSVDAIASDKKGGYDKFTVRLPVGGPGVPFGGVVAGSDGTLLDGAAVEINGQVKKTDAQGRFITYVPEAARYVFNIRKAGYGFYSKIYDTSVAGGRWTLTRATVSTFDPRTEIRIQDKRDRRNCRGPDSAYINWKEGPALRNVWWQDGKGNNVAPSFLKAREGGTRPRRPKTPPVILPWQRQNRPGDCGPGISVRIPANGLQTSSGAAPTGQVEVTLATVDLDTPEQMPGDDGVEQPGGAIAWMQSYGAGTVDLRDTGSGERLQLKPGVQADLTIPVDRSLLAVGAPLPPTRPLLRYDEVKGIWREEGVLTLDAARRNYRTKVKRFSPLNTDVTFNNPSCVRVESTITPPYDIEVTIPLPGGAAPKVKKKTITDPPPHVIYHLPNFTNITIVAISPGSGSIPPRSLGVFIVNTGSPQSGSGAPPPPTACATQVTLSTQTFPTDPDPPGEFLHGLFSFAGTTINEADIGNPGSVSQQLDQATLNYYNQIDPRCQEVPPNCERDTFTKFRQKNGFIKPPGFQLCSGVNCENPDDEINVVFANSGDLGFGRDMHCRRTDTDPGPGTDYDYACYVTNYGFGGVGNTDDALDADQARNNNTPVATVAMEYSRISDSDPVTDRHVKFYVYGGENRVNNADLDGKGRRPIPQLCMVCHGGGYPGGGTTGVPPFNTPDSVKLGSRFLPFDLRFYTFPASPDKAAQQSAMKHLNEDIVRNVPPLIPGPDGVADVIAAMYSGAVSNQKEEFVVPGWQQSQLPNTVAQETFYKRVLGNACRTCHITQLFANVSSQRDGVDLTFRTARDFLRSQPINPSGTFSPFSGAEQRVCSEHVMPHASRTHDIFWGQYWQTNFGAFNPTLVGQFQAFGDTIKNLPRPAAWPAPESWPPAWNGELCGAFTPGGATPPSYYSSFVHILWSRNYGGAASGGCAGCHSDLSGNATDTRSKLLSGFFNQPTPEVIPNDSANSNLIKRLTGTTAGDRMPQNCPAGGIRCLNEAPGLYDPATDLNPANLTTEINRIKYWIDALSADP